MKKIWKRVCTGILALTTILTALPITSVQAAETQYWTESSERVGYIEHVMNDGTIHSTFNEGHMRVEGETAYCVDINTGFKNGYKTRHDASASMSAAQIEDVALSLEYVKQYKMIVVFDGDIFEEKVLDYDELIAEGEKSNILAVSNPAFELFLLLHYKNSYEDDIEPNAEQIIKNQKDGHQTFISAKGGLPVISVGSLMKFEKMTENKKVQNKHSILFCTFFILNDILNR